jgi:hypothetical protein
VGWLARGWDLKIDAALLCSGIPSVAACVLPFYLLIVLRGSLLQATAGFVLLSVASTWVAQTRQEK